MGISCCPEEIQSPTALIQISNLELRTSYFADVFSNLSSFFLRFSKKLFPDTFRPESCKTAQNSEKYAEKSFEKVLKYFFGTQRTNFGRQKTAYEIGGIWSRRGNIWLLEAAPESRRGKFSQVATPTEFPFARTFSQRKKTFAREKRNSDLTALADCGLK